jgi:four helix bundle suffix protein
LKIRAFRETTDKETNLANLSNWANLSLEKPEGFANLMICLIYKETFLLDQLLRAQEKKFVEEGGFRENLFRKRREFLKKNELV